MSSSDVVVEEAVVVLFSSVDGVDDGNGPICDPARRGRGTNAMTWDAIKLHKPTEINERNIMIILISILADVMASNVIKNI